jgi:hypothetical protein
MMIKQRLAERGLWNVFWKVIWDGDLGGIPFFVVKALSLELESLRSQLWHPGRRAIERLSREQEQETSPDVL